MQLELILSNEARALPGVRALVHETLRQLPLATGDAQEIGELAVAAVGDAIEHAYRPGESGSVKLVIQETGGRLEIRVRDYGIPQDVEKLERQLHDDDSSARLLFGHATCGLLDEMHWLAFGPEGKALQLRKWLHDKSVADGSQADKLEAFHDDAPLAPPQQYDVRRMLPEEAVQVSQLMYRTYGRTYFNPDVYYPERVAAQNASGAVISIVACAEDGYVAGHSALELNQEGPVAETGQGVVDPSHRGRGLLNRMKEVAVAEAQRLDLAGMYADTVTVHALTQKSNADHGGHLTCVNLGISPKSEEFRGFPRQEQRVTCLTYFHWLKPPQAKIVFVPDRHRGIVAAIYEGLQCPVQFADGDAATGHGLLVAKLEPGAARAVVRVDQSGADTVQAVRRAKHEAVERSRAEVVFVDLPLSDRATSRVAAELEDHGFAFAGIAPDFSPDGDLLRLAYLVEPLAREPIKTYDAFAARLVEYALAEQARVRES